MKNFVLGQIKLAITQGLVSRQDVETLLKQIATVATSMPVVTEYLRQLFIDEVIAINPTDGARTITKARDVFTGDIDSDTWDAWNLNRPSKPTTNTSAVVYEMTKDGTFVSIFGSLGRCLDNMCFTQSQIIDFVTHHKDTLRKDGQGTFFLLKEDDTILSQDDPNNYNLFVAQVCMRSDGRLNVDVHLFSYESIWYAYVNRRFAVPQLTV